jgi:transposase-like protein
MDRRSLTVVGEPVTVTCNGRRYFSRAHKEAVVAKCLVAGASVSAVAQANGLRCSVVRRWVRQYEAGQRDSSAKLLAVRIEPQSVQRLAEDAVASEDGSIELRVGQIELTVRGRVERASLVLMLNAALRAR